LAGIITDNDKFRIEVMMHEAADKRPFGGNALMALGFDL